MYEEAIENCDKLLKEGNADDKRLLALRITLRFNLACSYDTASRIGEASEIFKQITREEPSYTDAYMRLAYLAQRRGDFKRAIEYIDSGKSNKSKDPNQSLPTKLYCMKGRILQDQGMFEEAYKEYQKAL